MIDHNITRGVIKAAVQYCAGQVVGFQPIVEVRPAREFIILALRGGGLEIVEVKIPRHSNVVGKRIRDLLLPQQSLIILTVDEEGTPRIPSDETVVRAGDEVVAVTRRESEDALRAVLTGGKPPSGNQEGE